ncbi:MAG TPA: MFS transporter [Acidimicrobiia bacterium]|nr:MFS transporter [Acidimicrobiia bacterium]
MTSSSRRATPRGGRYLALLRRNPDLRRLYLSRLISFGGDWFLLVPMLGLVNELSGSPVLTAAVLAANTLPAFLASPFGGVLADRFDRRKIVVAANLAAAGASATMLFVDSDIGLALGGGVPLALAGLAVLAVLSALIAPATSAALPALVAPEDLADATFLVESTWGTMAAVGSALGGLVATVLGRDAAIAVDAMSFLVAGGLIWRVRQPMRRGEATTSGRMRHALGDAWTYVRRHPPVAALLTSKAGFAIFGGGAVALLPVLALEVFRAGDAGTGLLLGARGVGVVVGPFIIRAIVGGEDRRLLTVIGWTMALWGVSYLGTAQAPTLLLAAAAVLVGHAGAGSQWSFSSYGLQRYTDDFIKGRIFGLDFAAVTLTATISQLAFGWLAETVAVRRIFTFTALAAVAFGIAWWRATRRFWQVPPRTEKLQPPAPVEGSSP